MKTMWVKLSDVIKFFEDEGTLKAGKLEKIPQAERSPHRTHGSCCYCDTCGYGHDDCVCIHNETIEWINSLEKFDGDI